MEDRIKNTLRRKRDFEAESRTLHQKAKDGRTKLSAEAQARMMNADEQLTRISNWLLLLSEDEAYVITRHLIDGIDMPRITYEYKERWGDEYSKTDRTIKSYQRKAIQKIAKFERAHQSLID